MRALWIGLVLLCLAEGAAAQARVMTLKEAWRLAEAANPALRSAEAGLHAAEGEARESGRFLYNNPELSIEQSRRRAPEIDGPEQRYRESAVGLSQAIEVAGQPFHRREAARRELEAAHAELRDARLRARGEVEAAFVEVLALQRRLDAEQEGATLAGQAAAAIGKRVDAGEDSRLDGNLARVEAERARNEAASASEKLLEARSRLAALLQVPIDEVAQVAGELDPVPAPYSLAVLLAAVPLRDRLLSLASREQAAESRLALERAAAVPDVTVSLGSAREGPRELRERVTTLSVSVPLPFFRRNEGAIGRARTELARAAVERAAAEREAEARVRALWARLGIVTTRVERLSQSVESRLEENLALSRRAYQAGELGIVQLVLVNRQVIEARRDRIDALLDYHQTRIALEQAAGWSAALAR